MATVPTVLPLNVDFTAYQVLLPVKGKEFVVGLHNMEAAKSLNTAKLDCCSELRRFLTGFEHIVQERLNQIMDVATFVEELKDVLEHILIAQPQVKLPPAAFYGQICSEIEVGWEHVAWVAPSFLEMQWRAQGGLKDILSQFEEATEKYQDFWTVMEDIDKHVWVMELEHPSRSNCFRHIAFGRKNAMSSFYETILLGLTLIQMIMLKIIF